MSEQAPPMSVAEARELAARAHAGQRDRDGSLHIDHVARVAQGIPSDPAHQRVAWLHDVVEDSELTADDLRGRLPDRELAALALLTHGERAQ